MHLLQNFYFHIHHTHKSLQSLHCPMYESLFPWHHIHTLSPVRCFSSLSPADLNDYIHILPLFRPALWLYRTDLWQCMSSHKCCRHHRSHRMADPSCYKYRWSFRPVRLSVLWVVPSDCNDKLLHFPVRPSLSSAGSACRTLYCLYFRRRFSLPRPWVRRCS